MSISRVIEVSFGGGSIAYAKVDTAYFYNNGIIFKPTDIDLPASYQVHWADSPQASTTLETIGTAEGAPIPDDLWDRSRVIYGWIYLHPTENSAVTAYEVRIYKNVRAGLPDGTEPTPAEQSTIDQLISAMNSAVEQTGQDAESASQSAQSAESAKTAAESARDTAGEYANDAESSAASASTSASQASASAMASAQSASQSAQIKADIESMVDDAQGYANSASHSASQASASEQGCARAVLDAASAAAIARARADEASGYAQTASTKASEAVGCVETASQKATESAQSATSASQSAQTAEQAKTASQTAQGLAESARDTAVSAKTDAESARDDAETARDEAQQAVASISGALDDKAPVITDTASGAIASFSDGADGLPLKSLVVDINPIQDLSHGDPSPENICPISGWTEVDVEQRAENLFDEDWESGSINGATGADVVNSAWSRSANYIPIKPQVQYYFFADGISPTNTAHVFYYRADKSYISNFGFINSNVFTPPANCAYIRAQYKREISVVNDYAVSINYPSTDHSYHPYTGRSITINLGQTVYGGKLDVLSGVLTIDNGHKNKDNVRKKIYTPNGRPVWLMEYNVASIDSNEVSAISSVLKQGNYNGIYAGQSNIVAQNRQGRLIAIVDGISSVSDIDTWLNANPDFLVVYKLATPITIQLTPNQINSLLGVNNIWADSGDTTAEYRADTKAYIAKKIAEAIASLT